ncbi:MAG: DUF4402 domain-containing protein [Alphaproteobacteria bacterium]|nr:DUF4402 domain-containing protein [Alphaproteobacteria bacterium]
MRKYFLTTAVALLAATNVTGYDTGSVNVNANIINITEVDSNPLNFGNIFVTENNEAGTVVISSATGEPAVTGGVRKVTNASAATFNLSSDEMLSATPDIPSEVTLKNGDKSLSVTGISIIGLVDGGVALGGTLNIPSSVPAGEYTGNITVTFIKSN